MTTPLLRTKLYAPVIRPELVSRPRLTERLNAGLYGQGGEFGRKLTLLSAPAGFGKTTLATEWLRSIDEPFAWLSLDEGDNDPIRFLNYLIAALRQVEDGIGQAVYHRLESPQLPSIETLLTELINDIASRSLSFVLVLDDYHTITELAVHDAVSLLLERLPSQMHLVIISRQDPPLQLPRLRGRGQATEIRQRDLRFTPEEATAFLNQAMGLHLETSEVAALDAHTEGWIAGLQMAALALQSRIASDGRGSVPGFIDSFSGRHHFILDYLTDEVLKRQPEPVYEFLLNTSILERMCGSLCDALADQATEDDDTSISGRQILERLQRANLLIVPLDDQRRWYRYHRLFADLLRARLQEETPDRVPVLHLRAASWYEQNDLPAEAIRHALAVPHFDLAADMIERATVKVAAWSSISAAMFLDWVKALPEDVVRARPRLRLFFSRVLYLTGHREATERILQELAETLEADSSSPDARNLLGMVAADRASYAAVRGDVGQAIDCAHRALACLTEDDTMMRMRVSAILGLAHFRAGNVLEAGREFSQAITAAKAAGLGFVAVPLVCSLAEVEIAQGQLRQALQIGQQAMDMAIVDGAPTSVAGFAGLELGKILYEQNDLPAAERHVSEGLHLLGRSGTTDSFGIGHALLARIKQAQGDDGEALAAIRRAIQIAQDFDIERISNLIAAYQARIWLAQSQLELVARWADGYRRLEETQYLREFEELTLVRVLLAQDEPSEALALLDALLRPAEAAGRMGAVIEILTLRALALRAMGDVESALDALRCALQLAEPERYARVFLDEGGPMTHLLQEAARRGMAPEYVRRLLAASEAKTPDQPAVDMSSLVEPLTAREMEVLELLAERLSNSEIAQQLVVSLPTVKSHTRNIYGKLGVHNRKEAVARGRALGILPS